MGARGGGKIVSEQAGKRTGGVEREEAKQQGRRWTVSGRSWSWWRLKLACEACDGFRQQGHNFCSVCGKPIQESASEEPKPGASTFTQNPVVDDDLRAWTEQGWAIQIHRSCTECGNPQICSRVEIREEEKGYNPGMTIGCNPLVLLGVWLLDTATKKFFPPRIVTMNVDRVICPRCRSEHYENSRVVSERPLR